MTGARPSPEPECAFLVGGSADLGAQLEAAIGMPVTVGWPADLSDGVTLFLDAAAAGPDTGLPYGNAFAACRLAKARARVRVFFLVAEDDPYTAEIARFCLADGAHVVDDSGRLLDPSTVRERLSHRRRGAAVDSLLQRLETDVLGDDDRRRSGLQRILDAKPELGLLEQLTDPETGLFDGPYAALKLEEEFKRAARFHQALSLILFDCGVRAWPEDPAERRTILAECASVFLNECRDIDVLARFTEHVFLCLLPGTGADGAMAVARRMSGSMAGRRFSVPVAVDPAVGLATVPATGVDDRREFLRRAEECLERARKARGAARLCASCE